MKGKLPSVKVGDVFPTDNHGDVVIVKYENAMCVTVMFQDGNTKLTSMTAIRLKSVKNVFTPSVQGIGYLGCEPKAYKGGKLRETLEYRVWFSMLRRCYDESHHTGNQHYIGCTVTKPWHNFKVFSDWYLSQQGSDMGWHLDKDLLVPGNKVYSPETCVLVPLELNALLPSRKMCRGECPMGVYFHKKRKKYIAQLGMDAELVTLGAFDNPQDAFALYKTHKEAHVNRVALRYKDVIPEAVYNNLMNFTVSITD